MDSCHLFNFLFGPKKATTELGRCFASMAQAEERRTRQARQDSDQLSPAEPGSGSTKPASACEAARTAPQSPLRQLQMKIVNLASNRRSSAQRKQNASCDHRCGTYRAHLVQSSDLADAQQAGRSSARDGQQYASCTRTTASLHYDDGYDDGIRSDEDEEELVMSINENSLLQPEACSFSSGMEETQPDASKIIVGEQSENGLEQFKRKQEVCDSSWPPGTNDNSSNAINDEATSMAAHLVDEAAKGRPAGKRSVRCKRLVLYGEPAEAETDDKQQQQQQQENPNEETANCATGQLVSSTIKIFNVVANGCAQEERGKPAGKEEPQFTGHQDVQGDNNVCKEKPCRLQDKRNAYVRTLVQSFESNACSDCADINNTKRITTSNKKRGPLVVKETNTMALATSQPIGGYTKPVTFVKPMPMANKSMAGKAGISQKRSGCLTMLSELEKPLNLKQLFQDETFLRRFFDKMEPLDRCAAAQVCRLWRNILYSNQNYWKDLINVIDCTQLRRDHLVECILNTLQTAKSKQSKQQTIDHHQHKDWAPAQTQHVKSTVSHRGAPRQNTDCLAEQQSIQQTSCVSSHLALRQIDSDNENSWSSKRSGSNDSSSLVFDIDQEDVWRIQELCNRFQQRSSVNQVISRTQTQSLYQPQPQTDQNTNSGLQQLVTATTDQQQPSQQHQSQCSASKSCSIPSQISSTLSSISISSLLSPLSESSRVESIKSKLYSSIDDRGFDALCLFGATDDDIEDLICKFPSNAHKRIVIGRLNNCCITNRGLELFLTTFNQLQEIELSGCNEITNSLNLRTLTKLIRFIITDCINISDGLAHNLIHTLNQLDELTIQAYHLTDAFLEYLSVHSDTSRLKRLELPNCKEITNQSLVTIAKHFCNLESLSISGSTKISDDGIEMLADHARYLKVLDLSWCSRITDSSLERISSDLADTLTELILDRNVHITDIGLGCLVTMSRLTLLHIRWCPRITDVGMESVMDIKSLRYLSIAGLHQITTRSLLCLTETDLLEVELTNCPAVNSELLMFLSAQMPKCTIIF